MNCACPGLKDRDRGVVISLLCIVVLRDLLLNDR